MKFIVLFLFFIIQVSATKRGTAHLMDFDKRDRGTWYTGQGLKNAACYGRNGLAPFNPSASDMIGAMAMRDLEQCYKCMRVTNNRNSLSIVVKIVDKCEACKIGGAIDLTPRAFQMLSKTGLNIGVLDISYKQVRCPRRRGLLYDLPFL